MAEEELLVRFKGDSSSLVAEATKSSQSLQDVQKSYLNFSSALEKIVNPTAINNYHKHIAILKEEIRNLGGTLPSITQVDDGVKKMTGSTMQARYAVVDLGHMLRDLPYAMSNPNVLVGPFDRMVQAMTSIKKEGTGFKGVLNSLGESLKGGGGILLGVELVTSAIALFGQTLFEASKKTDEAKEALKRYVDVRNQAFEEAGKEETKVLSLIAVLQSESSVRREKIAALKELKQLNPEIFGQLKLEGDSINGLSQAYKNYLSNIKTIIAAKIVQNQLEEVSTKLAKLEGEDLTASQKKVVDMLKKTNEERMKEQERMGNISPLRAIANAQEEKKNQLLKVQAELMDKLKEFASGIHIHTVEIKDDDLNNLRLENELLAEHLRLLKELGIARTKEDSESPDEFFQERLPKPETPYEKYLKQQLANQPTERTDVHDFTGGDDWKKGFQEYLLKAQMIQIEGKLIGETFKSAFQTMFSAINAGKPVLQAFFDGVKRSVEQLIEKLAEAAAEAAFISLLSGGAGAAGGVSFWGAFKGLLHFSQGGLVPGAGNGDTVPAMLTPGEYIVPKDQVSKVLQLLGASSGNLPIASTAVTSSMSGRQFRSSGNNSDSPQIVGVISGNDILLLNTKASSQKRRLS